MLTHICIIDVQCSIATLSVHYLTFFLYTQERVGGRKMSVGERKPISNKLPALMTLQLLYS